MILRRGVELPPRCVACNEPAAKRVSRTIYWHSPWIYLLIPVTLLLYIVVGLIARKSALVNVPLCAEHVSRRRRGIGAAWAVGLLGLAAPFAAVLLAETVPVLGGMLGELWAVGLLSSVVALFVGNSFSQPVRPKRIDRDYVWLRKCSSKFLATLPQAPAI